MFVEIGSYLLAHKLVAFLALAYIVVVFKTVVRFNRDYTLRLKPFERLIEAADRLNGWKYKIAYFLLCCMVLIMAIALSPLAPVFWAFMLVIDRRKRAEDEARSKAQREERDRRIQYGKEENERRTVLRKEWLEQNKLRLYCKTMDGITAVLTPDAYTEAQRDTRYARLDGYWANEKVLRPSRKTFVFVTVAGQAHIEAINCGSGIVRYMVAGMYSKLQDLVDRHGIELVQVDDIFVPWVNEAFVKYGDQVKALDQCATANEYEELVASQFPKEMRAYQVVA